MGGKQAFRPPRPVQRPPQAAQQSSVQSQTQPQSLSTQLQTQRTQKQIQPHLNGQGSHQTHTQNQNQDLTIVTHQTSLQVIKTTLEASVGLICFLRNLFPSDHFDKAFIAPSDPPSGKSAEELYHLTEAEAEAHLQHQDGQSQSQSQVPGGSQSRQASKRTFSWRRLVRGKSQQADTILNLLKGLMDGVSRGYVQSMALIIFLDEDDPSNIIESYTFNFFYNEQPGGPPRMEIQRSSQSQSQSQVPTWARKRLVLGEPISQVDVRRAVKHYVAEIIKVCQEMGHLPSHRLIDLKVYYNKEAPPNYEVPGFADTEEMLTMSTRGVDEPPAKIPMEHLQTGHHGIAMTALSIADLLPERSAPQDDETDEDVQARLEADQETLQTDLDQRHILWNSDIVAHDRKTYEPDSTDVYSTIDPSRATVRPGFNGGLKQPIGMILENGDICAIPPRKDYGHPSDVPRNKRIRLNDDRRIEEESIQMSQTMPRESVQNTLPAWFGANHESIICDSIPLPASIQGLSSGRTLPPKHTHQEESLASTPTIADTQPITNRRKRPVLLDLEAETLPLNRAKKEKRPATPRSSVPSATQTTTTSKSPVKSKLKPRKPKPKSTPTRDKTAMPKKPETPAAKVPRKLASSRSIQTSNNTEVVDCYCSSTDEQIGTVQCDCCHRWIHGICAGFIDLKAASRRRFSCLGCQMREDMEVDWSEEQMAKAFTLMSKLSLMRRAMVYLRDEGKLDDRHHVNMQQEFGCTGSELDPVIQELEHQGFLEPPGSSHAGQAQASSQQWSANPKQVQDFSHYFKPGQGIEEDIFQLLVSEGPQKAKPRKTATKGKSVAKKVAPKRKRPISTHMDIDPDAEGEPDSEVPRGGPSLTKDGSNGHITDQTANANGASNDSYDLPNLRSGRANALLDLTDYWS